MATADTPVTSTNAEPGVVDYDRTIRGAREATDRLAALQDVARELTGRAEDAAADLARAGEIIGSVRSHEPDHQRLIRQLDRAQNACRELRDALPRLAQNRTEQAALRGRS